MEVHTFFNTNTEGIQKHAFLGRDLYHVSVPCPGQEVNQDSSAQVQVNEKLGLLILADGMGGYEKGDKASKLAIETVLKRLKSEIGGSEKISHILLDALEDAHQEIRAAKFQGGTTLSICEITPEFVRFYNIGDSFSFLLGSRGLSKYRTIDDSITGYGIESGLLSEEKALVHEEGHIVTNVLGLDDYRVEVSCRLTPAKNDLIFMGSDGVSGNLTNEQATELIASGPIEEKLKNLYDKVQSVMATENSKVAHPDDLTCFLLSYPSFD